MAEQVEVKMVKVQDWTVTEQVEVKMVKVQDWAMAEKAKKKVLEEGAPLYPLTVIIIYL